MTSLTAVTFVVVHLAEELALVAIDPSSGRHALGLRSELNACLAGLLIAELLLDGVIEIGDKDDRVVVTGKAEPKSKLLAAATAVVIERGPKIKAILSHMDRGLTQRLGLGTWDAVVSSLVDEGVLAATHRGVRPRNEVLQPFVRDAMRCRVPRCRGGRHCARTTASPRCCR